MVGVSVRNPCIPATGGGQHLLFGNCMGISPAAKIGGSAKPRVSDEDRNSIIGNDGGIANRVKPDLHTHAQAVEVGDGPDARLAEAGLGRRWSRGKLRRTAAGAATPQNRLRSISKGDAFSQ